MTKLLLLTTMMFPLQSKASCNEAIELSRILYSEAQGESISGVIAIGEAVKSRSKRTNKSICTINGVTRKNPPERLKHYWHGMAKMILDDKRTSTVLGADSWNKGSKNGMPGKITRVIQHHVFYVMNGELK